MATQHKVDYTGLRKRPQMEQIIDYISHGQETITYPDRQAKFIRNHPYMTQLDFFDMQEDQEKRWEEDMRQREVVRIAEQFGMSTAQVRAMGTQTDRPATSSTATTTEAQSGRPSQVRAGSAITSPQKKGTSSKSMPAEDHPIYTWHSGTQHTGSSSSSSAQGGVSVKGVPSSSSYNHAKDPVDKSGPYKKPPPGTGRSVASRIADEIAEQDEAMSASVAYMDEDARTRVNQARSNENTKRQATQQMADVMLSTPFSGRSQMDVDGGRKKVIAKRSDAIEVDPQPAGKRGPDAENESERVKRMVQYHTGEAVQQIPYLPTSAIDIMDARAQALQNRAKVAEDQASAVAQTPAVSTGAGSSDFNQLATVIGESVNAPIEFNIGTPRGSADGDKRSAPPESVDSSSPTKRTWKSARTQDNFSRELTADEILNFKLATQKRVPTESASSSSPTKAKPKRKSARTQDNFSRELTADEILATMLGESL